MFLKVVSQGYVNIAKVFIQICLIIYMKKEENPSKKIILPLVYYKIFVFLFILVSIVLLPIFSNKDFSWAIHFPQERGPVFADYFRSWDSQHYLYIAEKGYLPPGSPTNAFYPLWPFFIKIFSYILLQNYLIAALILSAIFSIFGIYLFHYLITKHHSLELANKSTLLLLAYPGALFFLFPYSESLFFLLSVLFFWFFFEKKTLGLAMVSFLLPISRPVGVLFLIPLLYNVYKSPKSFKNYLLLLAPILGVLAYFSVMYLFTGNPLEGFSAQAAYFPQEASIMKAFDFSGFLNSIFSVSSIHSYSGSAIDRLFFLAFLILLPFLWKLKRVYFIFSLFMGVVPAMTNSLVSYTRYLTLVFPIFIAAAYFLEKRDKKWFWLVLASLFALQILLLIRHVNNYWVG